MRVTINGSNFTSVRSVRFGVAAGRSVRVLSTKRLQVTTPAHAADVLDVRVQTRVGLSRVRSADRYEFVAPRVVSALSVFSGSVIGDTRVTVSGSGFTHVTAVRFGTSKGTALKVLSIRQLQVTSPRGVLGAVHVQVWNGYGGSAAGAADHFKYVAATTVSGPAAVRPGATMTLVGVGVQRASSANIVLPSVALALGTVTISPTGTFSAVVTVPGDMTDGVHQIETMGKDGGGAEIHVTTVLVIDTTAPVVTNVIVPAPSVTAGNAIVFTAHVTDASGVSLMFLEVGSVDSPNESIPCRNAKASLKSGTVKNGIWTSSCTIATTMLPGEYELIPWGVDIVENWVNANDGPAAPQPTFIVTHS